MNRWRMWIAGCALIFSPPNMLRADLTQFLTEFLDDESDHMPVAVLPVDLDPVTLGFEQSSLRNMEKLIHPSYLQSWLDDRVDAHLVHNVVDSIPPGWNPRQPASRNELMARAKLYASLGLTPLAREQYRIILNGTPDDNDAKAEFAVLTDIEVRSSLQQAQICAKRKDLDAALVHIEHVLSLQPRHAAARELKTSVTQEKKLNNNLQSLIAAEANQGKEFYRSGKTDLALASFVRALNLDPHNTEILSYIEKIGQQIGMGQPE